MKFEIDQSGKIEQTDKNTILCLSNDKWFAILIEAKTKRKLQDIFRQHGQARNFVIFTFSAGLAILFEKRPNIDKVIIDREYSGKEAVIKRIVSEMLRASGKKEPMIDFSQIGKGAMAHHWAHEVASKKVSAHYVAGFKEILGKIKTYLR